MSGESSPVAGGGGPAWVYVHGFTGSAVDTELLEPLLPGRWATVTLPGHAGFEPTAAMDAESTRAAAVDLLKRTLDSLHTCAPITLIAYSAGARVVLAALLDAGLAVDAVVLVGATAGISDPSARESRRLADLELAEHILAVGTEAFVREWAVHPVIRSQQNIPEPWRSRRHHASLAHTPQGLAHHLRTMGQGSSPDLWPRLNEIRTPMLLLTGEHDTPYRASADRMCALQPEFRHHVISGVGHCAHLEDPVQAAAAILRFVAAAAGSRLKSFPSSVEPL